jgi:hypothetical protein
MNYAQTHTHCTVHMHCESDTSSMGYMSIPFSFFNYLFLSCYPMRGKKIKKLSREYKTPSQGRLQENHVKV